MESDALLREVTASPFGEGVISIAQGL
jgi:hypothetical protein